MDKKTKESVVEVAMNETGFGKFNIKVTIICYLTYLNAAITTGVTGFILPAAACDFKMNTVEKGRFGSAFLAGACFSPIICGFLSDIKGRRWILIGSLFLQGHSDLFQSIVPNYWCIIALKFISGLATTAQIFTVITYMSECIPLKQRNSLLSFIELSWITGHGFASVLGLAIIPLKLEYRNHFFFFRSWNLYVLICSLPAFFIGSWFIFFPETPKYVAEMGSREQLLQILIKMYEQNVGKPGNEYIEKLMKSGDSSILELVTQARDELPVAKSDIKSCLRLKILKELKHVGTTFKPPLLKNTFFACIMAFSITSSYYALFMWLPEIFQRFADFDSQTESGSSSNVCTVSHEFYSLDSNRDQLDVFGCDRLIDNKIFLNNIYICIACIPAVLPMAFLVSRLGFKFFIAAYSIICSAAVLGIYFVHSSMQTLILMCLYFSLLSVCTTGSFAFFTTIFPTNLRSSGVALTSFSSRIGAVFGNTICSYLIDNNCVSLIIIVTSQLVVSAISSLIIRE